MKKILLWLLTLTAALFLTACGGGSQTPDSTDADAALGKYLCTAASMNGMDIGPDGRWLLLSADGEATLYLIQEPDPCAWSLSGSSFTMYMGEEEIAAGTLTDGVLTVDLMGMHCTFTREDLLETSPNTSPVDPAQETEPSADESTSAEVSCYGDLYTITYPTDQFHPAEDGLSDLSSYDGTTVLFSKLDTSDDVQEWLSGFEEKEADQTYPAFQGFPMEVSGYPAHAVIYLEDGIWHSAVMVDFGKNAGTKEMDMAAACLYFSGPTWETVWSQAIQDMISTLSLPDSQ